MKRFYSEVTTREQAGGWQVTLDGRGLKTVKGTPQIVPNATMAKVLASEWDSQSEDLDPKSFPLRDMADYAIDVVGPDAMAVIEKMITYGDTDTLLYRADPDEPLFTRQQAVWEPIVTKFEARENVELIRVSGIIHRSQSETVLAELRERLILHNSFALAAIEAMTSLSASLVIGLTTSIAANQSDAIGLWRAACLEEEWQAARPVSYTHLRAHETSLHLVCRLLL